MLMFSPTLSYLFSFLLIATLFFLFIHFIVRRFWDKKGKISAFLCLIVALVCVFWVLRISFCAPDLFSMYPLGSSESANSSSAIYNLMSPFIAILAAILTFMAFWVQFNANQEMLKNNAKQQVERQFYEMLKIHKDNVNEIKWENWAISSSSSNNLSNIKIGGIWNFALNNKYSYHSINGRQVFEYHLMEYTFIAGSLMTALGLLNTNEGIKQTPKNGGINFAKELTKNAYYIYMRGKDFIKDGIFESSNKNVFFEKCDKNIDEIAGYITKKSSIKKMASNTMLPKNNFAFDNDPQGLVYYYLYFLLCFFKKNMMPYRFDPDSPSYRYLSGSNLFSGHYAELNHYYRHLYQMVKIIANYDGNIFDYDEKRKYLRMLRAQLTNDEQQLLFCNWLAGVEFGEDWENDKNHFFTEYRMIHNFRPNKSIIFEKIDRNVLVKMIKDKNPTYNKYDGDPLFEFENFDM